MSDLDLDALRFRARAALDDLIPRVVAAGVPVDDAGVTRLVAFLDELLDTGRHLNLVSRGQLPVIVENHVAPSLTPLLAESTLVSTLGPQVYLDVGSGGGFPGAVIAAVRPEWRVTLVDAVAKKASFLRRSTTAFANVTVERARVESLPSNRVYADAQTVITSRAVTTPDVVWGWVNGLLAIEGELHVYVRRDGVSEHADAVIGVAGRDAEVLSPLVPAWCEGAVLRVRRVS